MLVLTRRLNDRIMVGDNIEIIVVEVRAGCVRIGIEAPKDVPIVRHDAKDKEPRNRE